MKKVITYYADDGTPFNSESDCLEYEARMSKKETAKHIGLVMAELDDAIWNKYFPDKQIEEGATEENAYLWLKSDIEAVLSAEQYEIKDVLPEILKMIEDTGRSKEILKHIDVDAAVQCANIRRDFDTALENVENGSDLSTPLGWGFSSVDIFNLATLHKEGKHREKIEDLLTDCNFHYECGKFSQEEYDEFLNVNM